MFDRFVFECVTLAYSTAHYKIPLWKRRPILVVTIFGVVFGLVGLSIGLGLYFSRLTEPLPIPTTVLPTNTTLSPITTLAVTTTNAPSKTILPPEILPPAIGVGALALAWILGFLPRPTSTTTTTTTTTTTMTTTTTTTTTTTQSWSNWSECSPAHDCLDTVLSEQRCPVRSKSKNLWINGELTEVKIDSPVGCNCASCTFRLTDWVDVGCTRDAGINGGDGDCPCHWTQHRYCQQLSNGIIEIQILSRADDFYFRWICDENVPTWCRRCIIICL